jgi:hypothetical protein
MSLSNFLTFKFTLPMSFTLLSVALRMLIWLILKGFGRINGPNEDTKSLEKVLFCLFIGEMTLERLESSRDFVKLSMRDVQTVSAERLPRKKSSGSSQSSSLD